jgi:hypothetical protein
LRGGTCLKIDAEHKAKDLKKVSSKVQREIEQLLVDTEVRSLVKDAGRDGRVKAGAHFASMYHDKRIPGFAEQHSFWTYMALHAAQQEDKKLFKKIIKEYKRLPNSSSKRRGLKDLEERLNRL